MTPRRVCWRRFAALFLLAGTVAQTCSAAAKHVIICVADGGGFNAYAAGSYYEHGRLGCQVYDGPQWVKLGSRTYSLSTMGRTTSSDDSDSMSSGGELLHSSPKAPFEPPQIWDPRIDVANALSMSTGVEFKGYTMLKSTPTDSAASATAMASGVKVINGRVNFVPDNMGSEMPLSTKSIAEVARSLGKSAGVVTTVQWNDATPACFGAAHSVGRGSRKDIANEMLTAGTLDVIMGSGHPEYDRNGAPVQPAKETDYDIVGGSHTWGLLKSNQHSRGWKFIDTRAQFEALMTGATPQRVFGLVRNIAATQHERQTRDWNGDGKVDSADIRVAPPFRDPFLANSPSLATMARGAINVLSKNPKGFFLMVEGGAVDHAGHSNQPGRLIEEQMDFNRAVRAIVEWVETRSNWDETLVIVTADHETGMLWGSNSDRIAFDRIMPRGAGRAPGMWFNTGGHSNSLVPIRARGAGASLFNTRVIGTDPVFGQYVDNTTIFEVASASFNGSTSIAAPSGGTPSGDGLEYDLMPSYPATPSYSGSSTTAKKKTSSKSTRKTSGSGGESKTSPEFKGTPSDTKNSKENSKTDSKPSSSSKTSSDAKE